MRSERKKGVILEIDYCLECGHRTAKHDSTTKNTSDYHLQYEQKNFVESLKQTRVRQANLIYENLRALGGNVDGVVDVGCGRGWFLETLQKRGVRNLAGMENSKLGLSNLESMNISGIETDVALNFDKKQMPFAPRVLCFLDVLEHFAGPSYSILEPFMDTFRDSLEFIVIKVPISNGLLYKIANGLARLGWFGPLLQLYQAGTFPPHYHYFSARSIQILAHKNPLIASTVVGDLDFEPDSFRHRFWSAPLAIREICGMIGGGLYYAARLLNLYDSHLLFLDLRSARTSPGEDFLIPVITAE